MSDETEGGGASEAILGQLEKSGFFQQVGELETNLKAIAGDLRVLGETATQRLDETESLAAHVLAVEAILSVMLKAYPVDAEAVRALIDKSTQDLTGSDDQASPVQGVADSILGTEKK